MWKLQLFNTWCYLQSYLTKLSNKCYSFLSYASEYWTDQRNIWAFLPDYTLPIPLQSISNEIQPAWLYHSTTNILASDEKRRADRKLQWLSTQLSVTIDNVNTEYDIDDFISTFIISTGREIPTLYLLYRCWCITHKKWFPARAVIYFRVIDAHGDEQSFACDRHCMIH